jgi:hypothetical protein
MAVGPILSSFRWTGVLKSNLIKKGKFPEPIYYSDSYLIKNNQANQDRPAFK